jgi:hypothetical protein
MRHCLAAFHQPPIAQAGRPNTKSERNPLHSRTKYVLLPNSPTLTEAEDVNAMPPSPPTQAARNADMLQELIESGMQLARAAAARALKLLSAPDPTPEDAAKPRGRTPDPTQLFLRLWSSIRQTIAVQAQITTTHPKKPAALGPTTAVDRLAQEMARSRKEEAKLGTTLSPLAKMAVA